MCGIVGLVGRWQREQLARLNASLFHRGPDDAGEYHDDDAGVRLAMRRLSIIDIEGGHQPMVSADGSLWIVFNGEIFNAPELRCGLEARGRVFQTAHSDTECLLHLYAERGDSMVETLNGMFAFVLYDRRRKRLLGARDRFGIKPLYYAETAEGLAFASEAKSLLLLASVTRDVDLGSLSHYLSLRYVPGAQSIFSGVRRVPPARRFSYDIEGRELRIERYWRPRFGHGPRRSTEEWAEAIRAELRRAVMRWTLSDVPVACSLSGGLDSTSIVGLLAQAGQARTKTFTLGFSGAGEEAYSELALARRCAERWGTDHHELILSPDDLLRDLPRMVWHLDEPYGGGLPSWYVFEFMSRDVKVGLTGSGGDELFGNYGKWRSFETGGERERRTLREVLGTLRRRLSGRDVSPPVAPLASPPDGYPLYFTDEEKAGSVLTSVPATPQATRAWLRERFGQSGTGNARDGIAAIDLENQLVEEFLLMTDRFSMAHSLEARVPFLDTELVDLVLSIPAGVRTSASDLKYLLRLAIGDLLPAELLRAPKRGFILPERDWLRGRLRPLCERLLAPERLRHQGLLRAEVYETYVRPHLDGRADRSAQVWTLMMFELWYELFIARSPRAAPGAPLADFVDAL
jgi:asparagine synthase (glutamine-hydrolysing)